MNIDAAAPVPTIGRAQNAKSARPSQVEGTDATSLIARLGTTCGYRFSETAAALSHI
jgi:hypothetical protein